MSLALSLAYDKFPGFSYKCVAYAIYGFGASFILIKKGSEACTDILPSSGSLFLDILQNGSCAIRLVWLQSVDQPIEGPLLIGSLDHQESETGQSHGV